MATTTTTIDVSVQHPVGTHRRISRRAVAFASAAALLVGGLVATSAVILDKDDGTRVRPPAISDIDVHRIAGTLTPDDLGSGPAPVNDPLVTRFGQPAASVSANNPVVTHTGRPAASDSAP